MISRGKYNPITDEICVNPKLKGEEFERVLKHEMQHARDRKYYFVWVLLSPLASLGLVLPLAFGIFAVWLIGGVAFFEGRARRAETHNDRSAKVEEKPRNRTLLCR